MCSGEHEVTRSDTPKTQTGMDEIYIDGAQEELFSKKRLGLLLDIRDIR